MNFETLTFNQEGQIGILTISRPQALNALNTQMFTELGQFFSKLNADELRCLIVTGSGDKAFVAGADIKEMNAIDKDKGIGFAKVGQDAFQAIQDCPIPVIAAVNGYALGGGLELALACDFIIASENAKFGLPEVSLGIIPFYGGTQRLSRYIGTAKARMIALSGDIYTADKAMQWGLLAEVVSADSLLDRCKEIASKIIQRSPLALRLAKQAVTQGYELNLPEALKLETELFEKAFSSEDKKEGFTAFIEKRKPEFSGK
jgi:enoyl-CoA hydratase